MPFVPGGTPDRIRLSRHWYLRHNISPGGNTGPSYIIQGFSVTSTGPVAKKLLGC